MALGSDVQWSENARQEINLLFRAFIVTFKFLSHYSRNLSFCQQPREVLTMQSPNARNKFRAMKAKHSPLVKFHLKPPDISGSKHVAHQSGDSESRILFDKCRTSTIQPNSDFQVCHFVPPPNSPLVQSKSIEIASLTRRAILGRAQPSAQSDTCTSFAIGP